MGVYIGAPDFGTLPFLRSVGLSAGFGLGICRGTRKAYTLAGLVHILFSLGPLLGLRSRVKGSRLWVKGLEPFSTLTGDPLRPKRQVEMSDVSANGHETVKVGPEAREAMNASITISAII